MSLIVPRLYTSVNTIAMCLRANLREVVDKNLSFLGLLNNMFISTKYLLCYNFLLKEVINSKG